MNTFVDSGLVLSLPLPELDGGSVRSRDAGGHPCTVTGASWRPDGYSFDGIGDCIDAGNPAALRLTGCHTVAAWVRPVLGADGTVCGKDAGTAGQRGWNLVVMADGRVRQVVSSDGTSIAYATTVDAVPEGEWTFLAGTYDRTALRIYRDGEEVPVSLTGSVPGGQFDCAGNVRIGRRNDGNVVYAGGIAGVLVLNRAWAAAELQRHYLATKWRYR